MIELKFTDQEWKRLCFLLAETDYNLTFLPQRHKRQDANWAAALAGLKELSELLFDKGCRVA
jgi:hypothetical protein